MTNKLSLTFCFFVLVYLLSLPFDNSFSWLLKIIPIGLLGVAVVSVAKGRQKTILSCAIALSACGDVLLDLNYFIYGVAAFLLAQLCYALMFFRYREEFQKRWLCSLILAIYFCIMATCLMPHLGDLKIAVFAYLLVIALMGFLAIQSSLPLGWAVLGALVFILSDSLIAVDKFLLDISWNSYWVMISYYGAQWMLITGFLKAERAQELFGNRD
ncbi:lysoplasmalogenase [Alteromonadaceae bacterium BrNp21-10]|nr:lysoplasmalogenase [Alteromonadaceae bacterium BrNp21-10]